MQRKITKKLVSMIMVLIMAALLVSGLPMNVFAGTGKNGVMMAPYHVVSIQGDFTHFVKTGNQDQLKTTLCKGAELDGFISGNPGVATVDDDGTVTAVGPGETTVTAKAKLKDSDEIHTATCRVIVTGLIAEVMKIDNDGCTVKGTVYGKNGVKAVDGKVSKIDIGDVIEIAEDNKTVNIKDTVIAQNGSSVDDPFRIGLNCSFNVQDGGSINLNGSSFKVYWCSFNVQDGGSINVNSGGLFRAYNSLTINVDPGGTINVNSGGSIYSDDSSSKFTINVNSGGTVNVQDGGSVRIQGQGQIPSGTYHGPLTWNFRY